MNTTVLSRKKTSDFRGIRTREIYNLLKQDIIKKFPGTVLPSVKNLKDKYSVGQSTIVNAMRMLENEGLLVRKPRIGTFVSEEKTLALRSKEESGQGLDDLYVPWINIPARHITFSFPSEYEISMWNHMANVFNKKHSNISVVIQHRPDREISPMDASDKTPDMLLSSHLSYMNNSDFHSLDCLDLSQLFGTLERKDYYENAFMSDSRNRIWGISPYLISSLIVLNKTFFRRLRMNMPRLSWTWENVLDYSVQLKRQAAENDFKWGFALMGYMNYFFHSGVSFVDENGQCELDTPAMKRAVDFLKKMIVEEKIAPFWSDIRANNPMDMSMNGSSAIFEGYSFIKGKDDKGFEIEAMPFPFMPDSVDTLSSSPISISNKSSDIEGCLEFLKFIFSEEGQKIIASHVNSLPAMKSIVPPDISSERLKIQQKSAAEGELLYCRCLDIFSVRSIIESSVEQWLRFGGDLDKILKEAETICRWRIERKQQSKDTAFINI